MYRVVVKRINHRGIRIIEPGPWHATRPDAEFWAKLLGDYGYHVEVESQRGALPSHDPDDELRNALSSMA